MYKLVIGNKNYSSWSLRGWLAVAASGAEFEEILIPLETDEWALRIAEVSPTARVPVLIDGDATVWESLAIIEYLAERHPDAGYWPKSPAARAHARCAASEMHAGFTHLRGACPMNMRRPIASLYVSGAVLADVARITELWSEARAKFGENGPYLYGTWSAADMSFAPVVSRLRTYGLETVGHDEYRRAVEAHPDYLAWRTEGLKETWIVPSDEID